MRLETARLTTTLQNLKPGLTRVEGLTIAGPNLAMCVGVSVMVLYLILLPFVARTWRTTGDEPHYLLAAHSLVTDFDLDLTNNYAQLDYLDFYFSKDIVPQVRLNTRDQQILNHHPGLPVLIAPAYALGGRFGVLIFQALLGGLLATITFKLACYVSQNVTAALLATLCVVLSPPLLMYHYLIYPELMAALITTALLYFILTHHNATFNPALVVVVMLMVLPWLNRRFVLLSLVMMLLAIWSWRTQKRLALLILISTGLSVAVLIWFNSRLSVPARSDIIFPANGTEIWFRLVRGLGWLIDQQRGLFIYAPIYIMAIWGLPILIANSLKQRNGHWMIFLPFIISLGVITAAGGFWIAWEVGPRFLVVALPALAPLVALAWHYYGHNRIWATAAIILFALGLVNSLILIRNPEISYKSSLPLFYGEKLNLPLTEILPDLAEYTNLSPAGAGSNLSPIMTPSGEPAWLAQAGESLNLVNPEPLDLLPFGHYQLTWLLRTQPNLSPDTELARISVKYLGGGQLFHQRVTAADLPEDGSYGPIEVSFFNTNVDRWRTPMILYVVSTGQADLWVQEVQLKPNPFYAFVLPYLYLGILVIGAAIAWHRSGKLKSVSKFPALNSGPSLLGGGQGWILLVVALLIPVGYLVYTWAQANRTYQTNQLAHFVGRAVIDPDASDNQAWRVDPAIDPPQKATSGPFDFYDPGEYQVAFRLKLPEPVDTEQEIARLQVSATANFDPLIRRPILMKHFSKSNLYHDMVLTFNNPRRQALSFEVHYLGVAPLMIDEITVTKIEK